MAFEFRRKESVCKGVRRLARRRIRKALKSLKDCERLESVHDVRKDIKELRALLRLVRVALPKAIYRKCTGCLRQAGQCLGAARDAHVKVSALAKLLKDFKEEVAPRSFRAIEDILSQASLKQQKQLRRRHARRRVCRLLKSALRAFSNMKLKESGWSALGQGIKDTYGCGRQNFGLARETGTAENFHEFRKRVKDLFYQTGLLCPIWPEQMSAAEADLKRLGEFLGDDHDLTMLLEPATVAQFEKGGVARHLSELRRIVEKRQKKLRGEALGMGKKFYQEEPSAFCRRLEQYWDRWRSGPKRVARVA